MNDLTPAALALFARTNGMATGTMLRRAGVSRNRRRRLLEEGLLEQAHERVYRLAGGPSTVEARCAGLCLAHPRGFVTGPTAGRLVGLRRMGPTGDVHFSAPHGSNIGPIDGVRLRQTTRIEDYHLQRRSDGIVVASAPRLAFDLASDLSDLDHASVVEQILAERRCTLATLGRIGKALVHPRRRGSMQYMATLASRVAGGPLESHPEVMLAKALRERGIPVEAQHRITLCDGARIRFDLAVPEILWAVEVDGWVDHFLLDGGTADRRRDRRSHRIGWQVERVTCLDLLDMPTLVDELAQLYAARTAAAA